MQLSLARQASRSQKPDWLGRVVIPAVLSAGLSAAFWYPVRQTWSAVAALGSCLVLFLWLQVVSTALRVAAPAPSRWHQRILIGLVLATPVALVGGTWAISAIFGVGGPGATSSLFLMVSAGFLWLFAMGLAQESPGYLRAVLATLALAALALFSSYAGLPRLARMPPPSMEVLSFALLGLLSLGFFALWSARSWASRSGHEIQRGLGSVWTAGLFCLGALAVGAGIVAPVLLAPRLLPLWERLFSPGWGREIGGQTVEAAPRPSRVPGLADLVNLALPALFILLAIAAAWAVARRLLRRRARAAPAVGEAAPPLEPRFPIPDPFVNPFRDPALLRRLSPLEIVVRSFVALQAYGRLVGRPRLQFMTPLEYASELRASPLLAAHVQQVAWAYAHARYSGAAPAQEEVERLGIAWCAIEDQAVRAAGEGALQAARAAHAPA